MLFKKREKIKTGLLILDFLRSLIPAWKDIISSIKLFLCIILGAIILLPLTSRLPVVGWDWYFFFTAHHPVNNINNPLSPFFPYTKYLLAPLMWLPWRDSLALLSGITYLSIATGVYQSGGKYGSILLALLNPIPIFALWVGHPEGLALLGMLTNFTPLAFIKPQLTFWSFLRNKVLAFWAFFTIGLVLIIWPGWLQTATGMTWNHDGSFGWQALGWPLLLVGIFLLIGAGNDPWRLIAAGCFITPDVMPYHMVALLPAIGRVKGGWKIVVWLSTWLLFVGVGLGGNFRFINLLFPLSVYFALQTPIGYLNNIRAILISIKKYFSIFVVIFSLSH